MRQEFAIGRKNEIYLADSGAVDAFSRLRISGPVTLYESQAQYGTNDLRMDRGNSGDGVLPAWNANSRLITLQINAGAAGGTSFVQSFAYLPYQPGKSQQILITGVMGAGIAGAIKRFGYGDAANGIFYEQNGTGGLRFNRRTSTSGVAVDNTVNQADWNLDRLDGTGPSGITLDPSKAFILVIDLQFLGMGRVRVGFDISGRVVYAHQFLNANVLTLPYMQTASLPVMGEIQAAAGLGSAATSFWKCATVVSEGGFELGLGREFHTRGSVTAASGARTHILSVRPKLTYNGITNRIFIEPFHVDVLAGLNPIYWELCIGAAFTVAPAWADVNTTYSGMEAGTGGTFGNLTNGLVMDAGLIGGGAGGGRVAESIETSVSYPISLDRAGLQRALGTLSLLVTGIGGTSACEGCLGWHEIR